MARAFFPKQPKPIEIAKYLGINEAVGETQIKLGEWAKGYNFRVTKNMKAQKRPGHQTFINFGTGNAQGIWKGQIDSKNLIITCWNGNVYAYDRDIATTSTLIADLITEGVVTILGSIADLKTQIFWFYGKLYFKNTSDFKEYDGTTYQDVETYTPTVALASPPSGGGTLFEEVNLLSGKKTQTFTGDGSSILYQLAESGLDTDLLIITVNGATKVETVDFTVDRTLGQVTFTTAPINEAIVSITWVKESATNKALVINHKFAKAFGYNNDTNIFIFGNVNEKNVFRYSGINKIGYFPVNSYTAVGNDEYAITDLMPQYQTLFVFKEVGTKVVNPSVNPNYADNTGLNPYNYGYAGLNDSIGNLAPNMVQLIKDNPISLDGFSMRLWGSTRGVRNEIEPDIISDRLKLSLQVLDLSKAITFDYEFQKEYWVNVDNIVYIWNYGNDTMYKYSNIQATEFIAVDNDIYYCANGTIQKFSEGMLADGEVLGDTIPCKIYGGFNDLDSLEYKKVMREERISISPASRTSVKIAFITDKKNEEKAKWKTIEYALLDFNNIDFNNWTFLTNRSPQVKRLNTKVKKFAYIQWILENDTNNESLTVLKMLLSIEMQGKSK